MARPPTNQRFVDAAHAAGLGVIQEVVYNHLGPSGNYLPKFGPYLKQGDAHTWGDSVNLDGPGSDVVREYILDNAALWLRDYHVDGLRLDAVHALRDERAVHSLEDVGTLGDAISAETSLPKTLIAEPDLNNPHLIYPRDTNGYGLADSGATTSTTPGRIKEFERMGWDPAVVPDPQDPEHSTGPSWTGPKPPRVSVRGSWSCTGPKRRCAAPTRTWRGLALTGQKILSTTTRAGCASDAAPLRCWRTSPTRKSGWRVLPAASS